MMKLSALQKILLSGFTIIAIAVGGLVATGNGAQLKTFARKVFTAPTTAPSPVSSPSMEPAPTDDSVLATESGTLPDKAIIEGFLIYPASGIPKDMRVCAENISNQERMCGDQIVDARFLQNNGTGVGFSLTLPKGTYTVYSYLSSSPKNGEPSYKAYYNEFVTCGLKYECKSHTVIPVTLNAGDKRTDIYPHDWYNDVASTSTPKPTSSPTATPTPLATATPTPTPKSTIAPILKINPNLLLPTPTPTPTPIIIPKLTPIKLNF